MRISKLLIAQCSAMFLVLLSVLSSAAAQQHAEPELQIDSRVAALQVLLSKERVSKERAPDAVREFANAHFRLHDSDDLIGYLTKFIAHFHGASLTPSQELAKGDRWSRAFMASGAPAGEPAYFVVSFGKNKPHYIRKIEDTIPHSEPGAAVRGSWADTGIADPSAVVPRSMTDSEIADAVRGTAKRNPATVAELARWRKTAKQMMAEAIENRQFHGSTIILAGDDVVFEGAYGHADIETGEKNTLDTRFRICSLTKLFTQVAILKLIEQGKLELDGRVSKYRPGFSKDLGGKITIRHLLQMRSGLPRELSDNSATSGVEFDEHGMAGPFLDSLDDLGFEYPPGTNRSYSNVGYWLLGSVIEAVTGKPYAEAIAELIFLPLEMEDSGFGQDETGVAGYAAGHRRRYDGSTQRVPDIPISPRYSSGGLHSTSRDMVKFMQSFATGKILSKKSLGLMFTRFGSPRHETTKAGGPLVKFLGHVPGFFTCATHHVNEGYVVVFLNNNNIDPPEDSVNRVLNIIRVMRGDKPKPIPTPKAMNLKPFSDGFPKSRFARSVKRLLKAIETEDPKAIHRVFLATNELEPGRDARRRKFTDALAKIVAEVGGFQVFWEERNGALFVVVCGDKNPERHFTFHPSEEDPKLIRQINLARRD